MEPRRTSVVLLAVSTHSNSVLKMKSKIYGRRTTQMIETKIDILEIIEKRIRETISSEFEKQFNKQNELKKPVKKEPEYINARQVASLLGLSLPTISHYAAKGYLKKYRIGNSVRYIKHEVEGSIKLINSIKHRKEEYFK